MDSEFQLYTSGVDFKERPSSPQFGIFANTDSTRVDASGSRLKRELLLGCGHSRERKITLTGMAPSWTNLTTIDRYEECSPDIVHDLENIPYPFDADSFDEIHAYCVLEHLGRQGDWKAFLDQFTEFWRISKPNGIFCAICPQYNSPWAWGDPSHTRVIGLECLSFLSQSCYRINREKNSPMSDFTWYYKADWNLVTSQNVPDSDQFAFVLQAVK